MADEDPPVERAESSDTGIHDGIFCASCFSPVDEELEVCPNCEVLLSEPGPVSRKKTVCREDGTVRRRTKAPSALIVIGMWLILLPGLVIAFGVLMEPTDARVRISIAVGLVFWAYGAVLYKVTSRYFDAKGVQEPFREFVQRFSDRTEFVVITILSFAYFSVSSLVILFSGVRHFELTTPRVLRGIVVEFLLLLAVALILRSRGWRARRLGLQFSWKAAAIGIPLFVVYLLVYWVTATFVLLMFPAARTIWTFTFTTHAPYALVFVFIIINSIFEEVTVTAYVIEALSAQGAAVAITASTLLRLGYHLYQGPLATISIIPLGLLFGTLFWRWRNLWPLMVAHTITNLLVFALNPHRP